MTMPNFLVIGAAKSGTTALYEYLKQHPQIYMSWFKEPHYFIFEGERPNYQGPGDKELYDNFIVKHFPNLEAYRALFRGVSDEKAIGEATTAYLYIPRARDRIRDYVPEAKLIVMLRDPIERAYSNFMHNIRDRKEPLSDFASALQAEENRIQNNWGPMWHYKQVGFYYAQLKRYYEVFDREQIGVYLYEDLNDDPVGVLRDIYRFLGVDDTFTPDVSTKYNATGVPKNERLETLYNFFLYPHPIKSMVKPFLPQLLRARILVRVLNPLRNRILTKPSLPVEVRRQLTEEYREDILGLQELIRRDLSRWLQ